MTGYSTSLHLPLWVAYKLEGEVSYHKRLSGEVICVLRTVLPFPLLRSSYGNGNGNGMVMVTLFIHGKYFSKDYRDKR